VVRKSIGTQLHRPSQILSSTLKLGRSACKFSYHRLFFRRVFVLDGPVVCVAHLATTCADICADQGQLTTSYEAVHVSSELQVQNVWQRKADCKNNMGKTIFVASAILVDILVHCPPATKGTKRYPKAL